jgi:hypothetical protein
MKNILGQPGTEAVEQELRAELKRLRTELNVPDQDAPDSLIPAPGAATKKAATKKAATKKAAAGAAP